MKTSELSGAALDWAVAKCEMPETYSALYDLSGWSPSTSWAQGGPIIEREDISFRKYHNPSNATHGKYYAKICRESGTMVHWSNKYDHTGPTPLIAAMRCYVAAKLGGEVEIPDGLL